MNRPAATPAVASKLVAAMLEASPLPAEEILGTLPPRDGTVTVEKAACNAVMAGCQPAYFPVVLAAVKAVLQPQFNAGAITILYRASKSAVCLLLS